MNKLHYIGVACGIMQVHESSFHVDTNEYK